MEQRYMQMQDVTTRSDDNGEIYLEGLFAVYDSVYHVYPGATESIARGAFAESINGDVRALYNHNSDIVLGRK
ncbi:MAG: HK97 family phage prohead protease, partial [Lachnospiraceae bacterium]|nr:HK97 family phage prohead protease [Lachnospiraceae bacterium]